MNKVKFPSKSLIYCWWLWAISILYYNKQISYSPLISLIGAYIVTIYLSLSRFSDTYHWSKQLAIMIVETSFIYLVVSFNRKRKLLNPKDVLFNAALFLSYNIYLHVNGYNIFQIYLKLVPNEHKDTTFYEYYLQKYF